MMGEILRMRRHFEDRLSLPLISTVAPHAGLLAVQNVFDRSAVMHIGGRRRYRVDNLGFAVDTDMRLQAKIPLITFFCLMHLRVALAVCILGLSLIHISEPTRRT